MKLPRSTKALEALERLSRGDLLKPFADLQDPRVERTNKHLLLDVVILGLLTVFCGGEGWEDMEEFGVVREEWLRQFLPLPNGIPSADTFRQVFAELDPIQFQRRYFISSQGSCLPWHVHKELQAFLSCGTFEQGAACFLCDSCGQRTFLPFSCKTRSFCPSCCGRRMCDIAANLCDRVLPDVPYRQWVLSLPVPVRFVVLRHRELVGKILAVFLRAVFGHLRSKARQLGICDAQLGSLSFEQRFGDGARLHWHVHTLIPDGVFHRAVPQGPAVFVRLPAPHREELAQIVARIRVRVLRLLRRAGLDPDPLDEHDVQGDLLSG